MDVGKVFSYVLFDNPISKNTGSLLSWSTRQLLAPIQSHPVSVTQCKPLWQMASESGPYIKLAGVMGASAVILGAYGAHRKYDFESKDDLKAIFHTANYFHFFHSLAMLGLPFCKRPEIPCTFYLMGTILFCGSCYYRAFTGNKMFQQCAPIGGMSFIMAWVSLLFC